MNRLALLLVATAACHRDAATTDRKAKPGYTHGTAPRATAFADGGAPPADPALEKILGPQLTDFAIALDRGAVAAPPPALLAAFDARPALAPAWRDLLTIAANPDAPALVIRHAGTAFSDRLATAGLGYFVDAEAFGSARRHVALHAYRIDEVRITTAADHARVLVVHRIDGLGLAPSLFGMQSEDLAAVVLLDQIADHVLRQYVEVLAPDAPFKIDAQGWWNKRGAKVAAAAGKALRDELAAVIGDAAAAGKLGALAVERVKLLGDWPTHYTHWAHTNRLIDSVYIPDAYLDDLAKTESPRVGAIEDELVALHADRMTDALIDRFVDAVARHEAQHALDAARPTPLPVPDVIAEVTKPEPEEADADGGLAPRTGDFAHLEGADPDAPDTGSNPGSNAGSAAPPAPPPVVPGVVDDPNDPAAMAAVAERPVVRQTRIELSAYVSQIASEPAIPHLVLWALARNAFDGRAAGRAELYVADIVLEGLARHLGISTERAADHDRFDRQYLGTIAIALSQKTGAELRAAAAALWQELYGEPFVPVVLHQ